MSLTRKQEALAYSIAINPDRSAAATRRLIIADLKDVLTMASTQRSKRDELVDGEPGWVLYERMQMLAAVNDWRAVLGLPPADVAAVERIESSACGHIDYTAKYAIGCAEIALGERN